MDAFMIGEFAMAWKADDMEVYEGHGLFGDKYKDKYCYRDLSEATRELEKDLRSALKYRGDEIERHALDKIKWLVQVYNKEAQQAISAKINKL